MAKALYVQIMESLAANGIQVDKEVAKVTRIYFGINEENINEKMHHHVAYVRDYAATTNLPEVFVATHIIEALKTTKTYEETAEKLKELAAADKWIKSDIEILGVPCRIWVEKGKLAGMIKRSDESDKKLLSFRWGKKANGEWYNHLAVFQKGGHLCFSDNKKVYSAGEMRNKQITETIESALKSLYRKAA